MKFAMYQGTHTNRRKRNGREAGVCTDKEGVDPHCLGNALSGTGSDRGGICWTELERWTFVAHPSTLEPL